MSSCDIMWYHVMSHDIIRYCDLIWYCWVISLHGANSVGTGGSDIVLHLVLPLHWSICIQTGIISSPLYKQMYHVSISVQWVVVDILGGSGYIELLMSSNNSRLWLGEPPILMKVLQQLVTSLTNCREFFYYRNKSLSLITGTLNYKLILYHNYIQQINLVISLSNSVISHVAAASSSVSGARCAVQPWFQCSLIQVVKQLCFSFHSTSLLCFGSLCITVCYISPLVLLF